MSHESDAEHLVTLTGDPEAAVGDVVLETPADLRVVGALEDVLKECHSPAVVLEAREGVAH